MNDRDTPRRAPPPPPSGKVRSNGKRVKATPPAPKPLAKPTAPKARKPTPAAAPSPEAPGPNVASVPDKDRPIPISGEVTIEAEEVETNPALKASSIRKATTPVLEAYAEDARAAVAEYERQMLGEKDLRRVGRLHYEIGRLHEAVIGDLAAAGSHLDRALKATPDHLPTVVAARRVRLRLGHFDKALELFDREIRACSDRARASALHFAKARVLEDDLARLGDARAAYQAAADLAEGDPARLKALEEADRGRKAYPELSKVFADTATALRGDARHRALVLKERARVEEVHNGNADTAAELLEAALEVDPDVPGALEALARLHEAAGRWRDLVRVLSRRAELAADSHGRAMLLHRIGRIHAERLLSLDDAIKSTQAAVRAAPDPVVVDALASLHEQAGDYGAQAEVLSQLAELTIDPHERLLLLQRIGEICHMRLKDDETAITALEAALEIDPAHVPVLRILAPIYYEREAWKELTTLHEREAGATTETRRRAVAHARAAEIYERVGDDASAIQHREHALSLDAKNPGSFLPLVRLYRRSQSWRKLIELYERTQDQVDVERRIAHLFEVASISAERLDDPERAEHALRRILKLRPQHLGAVHALQRVSEDAGRYEQLVEALEREAGMIQDQTQIVALLHRAGAVLDERLSQRPKAQAVFKRVLAIDGKHLPTLAHLGRMYHGLGRWNDLVEVFERELESTERGARTVVLLQRMGEVYLRELAQTDRAAACFRRALDIDGRYAPAIRALTEILERQKAWKAIAALCERELTETRDPAARALAAMRAGALYEERLEDVASAERCFLVALQQNPEDRAARSAVERVRGKLERWADLATALEEEAGKNEHDGEAIENLTRAGEIWSDRLRDLRKAVASYVRVLEREPGHLGALLALEPLYRQARAWKQLAELFSRQFEAFEDRAAKVSALTERARLLEREKLGNTDDVIDCYTSILSLRPGDTGALMGLERYALRGHDPQVLAAVDARLALDAEDTELQGSYLTRRAESLEVAGNPEALGIYRDALALDSESRGALRGLARIAEVLGDDESLAEAARAEAKIARDAREEADAWAKSGRVFMERIGDRDEAAADFERALELWPDHLEAASGLSQLLNATTDYIRLAECLTRAASEARDQGRVAALWMEVAQIYAHEVRDPTGAIGALRKLLKVQPRNLEAIIELAELYVADRRVDEAIEQLQAALKLKPEDELLYRTHVLLAMAHESEGEIDDAFSHYASALDLRPDDADTLHRVVTLQVDRGMHAAVVDTAQRLLALAEDEAGQIEALVLVARAQNAMDRREEAIDTLAEAVALEGPSGGAAAELTRLAIAPHHWERYVVALCDFKAERQPKGRTLSSLYLEIARVQHEQLQNNEASLGTVIEGLQACEGDIALRFALGQRLRGAHRHAEALDQLEMVISDDVLRVDAWRLLVQTYKDLGLEREYDVALSGLAMLGEATHREHDRVRVWRPYTRAIPPGGVAPVSTFDLVVAPEQQMPAANLLSAICDGLGKLRAPDLASWGVSSRDKISPRSEHPLRALVERLASITGVVEYELYVHRHPDRGVGIENTPKPSVLMPLWIGEVAPSQQVFLLAEALVHVARGTYPVRQLQARELEIVLAAATRSVVPGFGERIAPIELLDDKQRLIMRGLPRRKRKPLELAAAEYARARPVDTRALIGWIEQTARRVAMIAADDLVATLEALRRTEELGAAQGLGFVRSSPIVGDLMKVWISRAAMQLRRKIRLVPSASPGGGVPAP
ncbi:MAG: tetratricopeptide repeat protein [Myxococcota bacterium]